MAWDSAVITNAGTEILKQCYAGGTLVLDYAAGGTSTVPTESMLAQTSLKAQKQRFSIVQVTEVTGGQKLNIAVENHKLEAGYIMNQIGIWGHIGDGAPVLLALLQDASGIQIPGNKEILDFALNFYAVLEISGEANFQINIDPEVLVSERRLSAAIHLKPDLIIGSIEPNYGPVLWFDTGASSSGAATLLLSRDTAGRTIQADVDGTTYGVTNAAVNSTPTANQYSFDLV